MSKYELTEAEIKNAPSINLGGRVFHIPKLAIRQNRVVIASLGKILPLVARIEAMIERDPVTGEAKISSNALMAISIAPDDFDMIVDAVYAACTRAYPGFARDEFDSLPIGNDELIAALPIVMVQSFAFTKKQEAGPQPGPGEQTPAALTPPESIGTASSSAPAGASDGPGTTAKTA